MEIKADVLEKKIDAIPGVCAEGKKAIKELFEEGFGVKFNSVYLSAEDFELSDYSDSNIWLMHKKSGIYIVGIDRGTGEIIRASCVGSAYPCKDRDDKGTVPLIKQPR